MIRKFQGRSAPSARSARGFTLAELLIVIAIIGLLSSMALVTLYGVQQDTRERSTRATVTRINEIVMARFESYRTRPVPVRIPPRTPPQTAGELRLLAIRQLMRMELPDRVTDVTDGPVVLIAGSVQAVMTPPPLWTAYRRRAQGILGPTWATTWSTSHQGAECLFMILATYRDGDSTGLDSFSESQIGDVDGDGMPEILDSWGRPIEFLRWAPGYRGYPGLDQQWGTAGVDDDSNGIVNDSAEAGWPGTDDVASPSDIQSGNAYMSPDYLDPLKLDYRWNDGDPFNDPFALYPLIFSAGRDKQYDLITDQTGGAPFQYINTTDTMTGNPYPNDPYFILNSTPPSDPNAILQMGKPYDASDPPDGINYADNITNQTLAVGAR